MIFISQKEFEDLKKDLANDLNELADDIDDETLQKIKDLSEEIKEKYSDTDVEEKFEDINASYVERFKRSLQMNIDVDPGRLMALNDGVFSIVMTLLVFGMALPEVEILTAGDFSAFILSIIPTVGTTLVCFILVSSFWVYHHEFIKIKNLNIPFVWINILYLAAISFIPFSTSIVGNYSHFFLAEVILGINIMLIIILFLLMFKYAADREFLEITPSKDEKKYIYNTFYVIMALTVIINLLDFNVSRYFIYLYFLVPIISTYRDIKFNMKS